MLKDESMFGKLNYRAFILIFVTVMLSNLQIASCYGWKSDSELWDLEYNDARFIDEVNAWTAKSLVKAGLKHSICGNDYLMGGYNILGGTKDQYFERTFTGLPPHNQLNLRYLVYPIDSWDGTSADDHYEVYVDDVFQRGWRFSAFTGYTVAKCGSGGWGEYPAVLAISTFIHSGPNVKIRFVNMLDQASSDESLGIREVKMKFVNVSNPENSLCGRSTGNVPLPDWPCKECDTPHQYMTLPSSGQCFECAESCATCNAKGCLSCASGRYLDKTACSQCTNGCATCEKAANYCLTCQSEWFMVSNACYPTCKYPLSVTQSGGINYCNTPCPNQYAMWDGTCSSTCSAPLSDTKMSNYKVCTFPCTENPVAA